MERSTRLLSVLVASFVALVARGVGQETVPADTLIQRGLRLLQSGRVDSAIAQLRLAIGLDSTNAAAARYLGESYLAAGRRRDAIPVLQRAIRLDPNVAEAHRDLGNAYADEGELDSAVVELRLVVALAPNSAWGHTDLGSALEHKGLLAEAVEEALRATSLDAADVLAWYNLGVAEYRLQHWREACRALIADWEIDEWHPDLYELLRTVSDKAVPEFERAVRQNPTDTLAHYYLAYGYSIRHDWGKAYREIDIAIGLDRSAELYKAKASFRSHEGKDEEAIPILQDCIAADRTQWQCYNLLGLSYEALKRPAEALDPLREAVRINPNIISVQMNLGAALQMVGENAEAAAAYKKAIELGAGNPRVALKLAVVYEALGEYDQAWRYVRIAKRAGDPLAQQVIAELSLLAPEPH